MLTRCRSCNAEIEMVRTTKGNWMPVDMEPTADGNLWIRKDGLIRPLTKEEASDARAAGEPLRVSHFATCPEASKHRKRS